MKAIVCVDVNWAIAKNGKQIIVLPEDRKRFRKLTTGGSLIVGKKTYDSFPGGVGLPDRDCYVLTHGEVTEDLVLSCSSVEELLHVAPDNSWVAGGETVYQQLFDRVDRCFVTMVYNFLDGDQFFPNLNVSREWEVAKRSRVWFHDHIPFAFSSTGGSKRMGDSG